MKIDHAELRARPIAAAVFVWWIIYGALLISGALLPGFEPQALLLETPLVPELMIAISITLGGISGLAGMLAPRTTLRTWFLERQGLLIGGLGWLAFAVLLISQIPAALGLIGASILFAACAGLRIHQLRQLEALASTVAALYDPGA